MTWHHPKGSSRHNKVHDSWFATKYAGIDHHAEIFVADMPVVSQRPTFATGPEAFNAPDRSSCAQPGNEARSELHCSPRSFIAAQHVVQFAEADVRWRR